MAWWTSNYALYPADRLLVRTSVRMTLSAPPNAYWLGTLCTDAKVIEEGSVDYEGMDPLQTEFKFFHDLHYPFTIDQFDWGCAVTQSLFFASEENVPVVKMMPLSARPVIAPRKSRTCGAPTVPL